MRRELVMVDSPRETFESLKSARFARFRLKRSVVRRREHVPPARIFVEIKSVRVVEVHAARCGVCHGRSSFNRSARVRTDSGTRPAENGAVRIFDRRFAADYGVYGRRFVAPSRAVRGRIYPKFGKLPSRRRRLVEHRGERIGVTGARRIMRTRADYVHVRSRTHFYAVLRFVLVRKVESVRSRCRFRASDSWFCFARRKRQSARGDRRNARYGGYNLFGKFFHLFPPWIAFSSDFLRPTAGVLFRHARLVFHEYYITTAAVGSIGYGKHH